MPHNFHQDTKRKPRPSYPLRASMLALLTGLMATALWSTTAAEPAGRPKGGSVSSLEVTQLERQMLDLINRDRASQSSYSETSGRALPLQWDSRLATVARAHSEEMAEAGYFSHTGLDGSSPMARVSSAGIRWRAEGENIAKAMSPAQAEAMFMDEPKFQPNHRGNILKPDYNRVGVGIAKAPDGSIYITQEFAQIP